MRKILLVDDNIKLREVMLEGLKPYRKIFKCLVADNGIAALEKLRNNHIHLLVTDLSMPSMNGLDLLATMNSEFPHIPCVAMSSVSSPIERYEVNKSEPLGYLTKPVRPDILAKKITTLLKQQRENKSIEGFSLIAFMKIVSIEGTTCSLVIKSLHDSQKGTLDYRKGQLIGASLGDKKARDAANAILSWKKITISIQDNSPTQPDVKGGDSLKTTNSLNKQGRVQPDLASKDPIKMKVGSSLQSILSDSEKFFDQSTKISKETALTSEKPEVEQPSPIKKVKVEDSEALASNERENLIKQNLSFNQLLEMGFDTFKEKNWSLAKLSWELALEKKPNSSVAKRNLKVAAAKLEKKEHV